MKLKLKEAVGVYAAVLKMMEQETSFAFAHVLCVAKGALEIHVQYSTEKEMGLIRKYAEPREDGSLTDQEGRFKVQKDKAEDYFREKKELDDVEIELERIPSPTVPEKITGRTLELLAKILDFPEDGGPQG